MAIFYIVHKVFCDVLRETFHQCCLAFFPRKSYSSVKKATTFYCSPIDDTLGNLSLQSSNRCWADRKQAMAQDMLNYYILRFARSEEKSIPTRYISIDYATWLFCDVIKIKIALEFPGYREYLDWGSLLLGREEETYIVWYGTLFCSFFIQIPSTASK